MPPPAPTVALPRVAASPLALEAAFKALKTYDRGSSRATLLPIDEAVRAAIAAADARQAMERRLITALAGGLAVVAHEFICSKLALIGTATAVDTLSGLLGDTQLATAARNALEAIPGPEATRALRARLADVDGMQKVGVIQSLGVRRDRESVAALAALLRGGVQSIASAAAAALGEIGSSDAAKALRTFEPSAPAPLRAVLADACLVCAERSLDEDRPGDAELLYRLLAAEHYPEHVREAASRGARLLRR